MTMDTIKIDTTPLTLVGSFCEVFWTATSRLAKRQCEKCVYVVRGKEQDMICLELIYDAIDGVHKSDEIHWVPMAAIQYLKVLTPVVARRRMETLEREAFENHPRD